MSRIGQFVQEMNKDYDKDLLPMLVFADWFEEQGSIIGEILRFLHEQGKQPRWSNPKTFMSGMRVGSLVYSNSQGEACSQESKGARNPIGIIVRKPDKDNFCSVAVNHSFAVFDSGYEITNESVLEDYNPQESYVSQNGTRVVTRGTINVKHEYPSPWENNVRPMFECEIDLDVTSYTTEPFDVGARGVCYWYTHMKHKKRKHYLPSTIFSAVNVHRTYIFGKHGEAILWLASTLYNASKQNHFNAVKGLFE